MISKHILGETTDVIELDGKDSVRDHTLALTQQTEKFLVITSRQLDHHVFDNSDYLAALTQWVTKKTQVKVKVLIQRTDPCITKGHRLVNLYQKLPSHLSIRRFGEKHKNYNEAFVMADKMGYLHLALADRYQGQVCYADSNRCQQLSDFFTEAWDQSEEIADFRSFRI